MVDKLSNYILNNFLYKDEEISSEQREIMLFGLTRILEDIPKYTLIILISVLLGVIKEVALVFLITVFYKFCVGGAHARTNIGCFILSTIYFLSPVFVSKYLNLSNNLIYLLSILIFVFSLYVILKIAPADTEEIPILNKKRRKLMKILAIVNLIILYALAFIIKNNFFSKLVLMSILYVNIMTTKPIYRLLRCKYSYESEEFKEYFKTDI